MKRFILILILSLLSASWIYSIQVEVEIEKATVNERSAFILRFPQGDGTVLSPGTVLIAFERTEAEGIAAALEEKKVQERDYQALDQFTDSLLKDFKRERCRVRTYQTTTAVSVVAFIASLIYAAVK